MNADHFNTEEVVVEEASRSALEVFTDTGRYALFMASIIMGIWFVGRIFEAATHSTIFEPNLVYWMGLSTWVLLGVFALATTIRSIRDLTQASSRVTVIISWLSFGVLAAAILYATQGYRIASTGLFAIMAGIPEAAQQTFFQLFKFFPATPMLPINLAVAKAMGSGLEIDALMPLVWSPSYIFIFFVWSLVYGALLLRMRGGKFIKIIHLVLASAGLFIMMTGKSISHFTDEQLLFLQVGMVVLFFMQVLLTYSSIRTAAEDENEDSENTKPIPLPPSAIKVALFLLIILPVMADLGNQFALSSHSKQIVQELATGKSEGQGQYVTAAQISVRSGPAMGDEVVGILPKGTRVRALDKKYGWVCIGENKWISSRLLRPRQMG
jgi:hypothetical protein